ncbi:MAG TPA: alpha-amylase family glycosyl hydrolase [Kiritimatiellia bacterium]|nr:alpha-amylase family glycosyl hydrolase [Kiritimatiellia bacterium]HMO97952.1 alpha-amylase family glycosyl hydrolase [Kiritimatiellia bacterium]
MIIPYLRHRFAIAVLGAFTSFGQARLEASSSPFLWTGWPSRIENQPGFRHHPSPADWRVIAIYQVITDRFYDGDPANNTAHPDGAHNPFILDGIHGGDFAGLALKLDYIRDLGFNALWISPVHFNHRGAYHGYHITDFNRIDPNWGDLDDLRALIDQAHSRGMYVFIDVVFNHMARLLTSRDPGFPKFSETPYRMEWLYPEHRFAPPFDRLDLFHAHGSIQNWEDDRQNVVGDLQGLADLRTEDPDVRRWLIDSHLALIAATDCDGFRIDTAHHVEREFWLEALPALREGAAALGKTNFFIFGEALRHRDEDVAILSREAGFPSMLYYPYWFTLHEVWSARGPTRLLRERWNHLADYGPTAHRQLVAFGDNHDRARLLNDAHLGGDLRRAQALLTLLYATPAIPCVYYGTEQGFSGSKGHQAREPMFSPHAPDAFDPGHPLANHIRRLNFLRHAHPALAFGDYRVDHDEDRAGLFVFQRFTPEQIVVVALNNSTTPRKSTVIGEWVDAMTGEPWPDEIPPDTTMVGVAPRDFIPPPPDQTPRPQSAREESMNGFQPDGWLDANVTLIASNGHSRLYGAFDTESRMAYLAVTAAEPGWDRFLFVGMEPHERMVDAPWMKDGRTPAYDVLVSDEADSDYTSVRGLDHFYWSRGRSGHVLEAAFRVPDGREVLWVRTATYQTHDRGVLNPDTVLPENGSWLQLDLEALRRP